MQAIIELFKIYPNAFADLGIAIVVLAPYAIYMSFKTNKLSMSLTTLSSDMAKLNTEIMRLTNILDKITTIKIKTD